jgi:hypothetical protein
MNNSQSDLPSFVENQQDMNVQAIQLNGSIQHSGTHRQDLKWAKMFSLEIVLPDTHFILISVTTGYRIAMVMIFLGFLLMTPIFLYPFPLSNTC